MGSSTSCEAGSPGQALRTPAKSSIVICRVDASQIRSRRLAEDIAHLWHPRGGVEEGKRRTKDALSGSSLSTKP